MQYGYIELFQLLNTTDSKSLVGFEIKPDGIWIDQPSEIDLNFLTPDELAAMRGPFTAHDMSKPVLLLPCSGKDLQKFMRETGFDCKLVEDLNVNSSWQPITETPESIVKRLRDEGEPDGVIAKTLKSTYPEINPSRIGKLVTQTAADSVTNDAYRKRGNKLLK
jgi:hypothetical protein